MDFIIPPEEISKIRKKVGLTQKKLAKLSNVSQALIVKIEKGEVDPSYSKIKTISNVLTNYLFKHAKKVSEIMSKDIIFVTPNEKVKEAANKMLKYNISQLPVIAGDKVVGSISEKSIVQSISKYKEPKKVYELQVKDIMNSPFPMVSEDTPLEAIYSLLIYYPAILVISNGKIVGIVTKADILKIA